MRVDGSCKSQNRADFAAEAAIAALGFLVSDEERLSRFLALSGLGPDNLRQAAASPRFLAAVLEYLCADERLLLAFSEAQGWPPAETVKARDQLAGAAPEPP